MRFNSVGCTYDEQVCSSDKETGLDDSGNQVQGYLEFSRIVDPWEMDIQNHMACFRDERRSVPFPEQYTTLGEGLNFSCRTSPAEGDHLNGKRE